MQSRRGARPQEAELKGEPRPFSPVPLTRDEPAPKPRQQPAATRGQDRLTLTFRPGSQAGPPVGQTRCRGRLQPRSPDAKVMREAPADTPTGMPRLRPRPHLNRGPTDADQRRRLVLSRGACARLPLTLAPPLSRRDVAVVVGACAPDSVGGGLSRPVSLVTCTPLSLIPPPPPPHTHLFGIAAPTIHIPTSNKPELLKMTKQQPVEEGGEAQRFKEDQHSNVCFLAIVPLTLATFLLSLQERPGNPAGSGYLLRFYI